MRRIYLFGLKKVLGLKFQESCYDDIHLEEGERAKQPNHCNYNNEEEHAAPNRKAKTYVR